MDFEDLKDDKAIQEKLTNFGNSVDRIEKMLELALNSNVYDKLSIHEKVEFDLFISYSLNTLYWLYLRTKGLDPSKTEIKNQLNRVKDYMIKAKKAHERNTIRPRVNQAVAERFVKHGINYSGSSATSEEPPAKKKKQ